MNHLLAILLVIQAESDFDSRCKNAHSTAYGYAQATNETWEWYSKEHKYVAKLGRESFIASSHFILWYLNKVSKEDKKIFYVRYVCGLFSRKNSCTQQRWLLHKQQKMNKLVSL